MAWKTFYALEKPTEGIPLLLVLLINMPSSSKRRMAWRRFMSAKRIQTRISTRRHIILSIRIVRPSLLWHNRYFGDDEDAVDPTLAPEQEAGQFAFGSNLDPSSQQFHFGDDVNMSWSTANLKSASAVTYLSQINCNIMSHQYTHPPTMD